MEDLVLHHEDSRDETPGDRIACAAVIVSIVVTVACGAFAISVQSEQPQRQAQSTEVHHE